MRVNILHKNSHNFLDLASEKIAKFFQEKFGDREAVLEKKATFVDIDKGSVKRCDQAFLNSIIHELKTPLNAIIGFSEALQTDVKDPKNIKECVDYAEEINRAANDLNEIIHDLLDVGSATSGNFSIDLSEEIDLKNLIARSIKLNYNYALSRGISIKTEIAENPLPVSLDAKRMKQILVNLISNAIKYSPQNTEIKIIVNNVFEKGQKFLEISVIDQGFGIAKEQIKTVFEKYQTITNPNSGSVDSFGLGLAITKQLVELQNGKIEVESEINQGTKMTIKFPLNPL
jgi:signal transduction histidine kinase